MKTFRNYLILAAGIGLLSLTMSFTNAAQVLAQGMKPLLMRNADAPALRPFQVVLCGASAPNQCEDGQTGTLEVPLATNTGEPVLRLLIEYVSTNCSVFEVTVTSLTLTTVADGVPAFHHFIPIATSAEITNSAQATRLYADPGSEVNFLRGLSGPGFYACRMSLSGHLVVK